MFYTAKSVCSTNGIGIKKMLKIKKDLQNVENRKELINGTVTFGTELEKGFKIKIVIPR